MARAAYSISGIKVELHDFLIGNPDSKLDQRELKQEGLKKVVSILEPWGDSTLTIRLPKLKKDRSALVSALNDVVLPKQYSAILHKSTGQLEVIWTAYKLTGSAVEVKDRQFDFVFRGKARACKFHRSSDKLLEIAKHTFPASNASSTNHRNIISFHFFATDVNISKLDKPMSFWVDCVDLATEEIFDFVEHLNAHMAYFDTQSPLILVHDEQLKGNSTPRDRYLRGSFPTIINCVDIDPNVIAFWTEMHMTKSPVMRFLLCARIVEYCSYGFVEDSLRSEIKRLLAAPDASTRIDSLVSEVIEVTSGKSELQDINRTQSLISKSVDLKIIWKEIERSIDFFARDTVFDGGFQVSALISPKCDYETWSKNGVRTTYDRIRQIRNALSHGKDHPSRGTIKPSRGNSQKLAPWLNLIEIISGEVMLYSKVF